MITNWLWLWYFVFTSFHWHLCYHSNQFVTTWYNQNDPTKLPKKSEIGQFDGINDSKIKEWVHFHLKLMSWKIPVLIKLCPLMFVHDVTNFHVLNTSSKCDVKKNWKSTYVIFLIFWKPKWWCKFAFVACLYQILQVLQRPKKHSKNRFKNITLGYNRSLWRYYLNKLIFQVN